MTIDWDRRRRNVRILLGAAGLKAAPLATSVGLSPNVLNNFINGRTKASDDTLQRILPALGLISVTDLDTDNVLTDPRIQLRAMVEQVPSDQVANVLAQLQALYPDLTEE